MSTFGVAMVKDEADIIGTTVRWMLTQVDHVIVADNGSTDGTREILAELGVEVVDDPECAYYQSRKMTALARMALAAGATWVVPFDADEIWTSRWGRLGDVLGAIADYGIVTAELYDHMATGLDDAAEPDPVRRMEWRRVAPLELPKVAFRASCDVTVDQGNHWATYPVPARPTEHARMIVHHLPYRSAEQMIRKVRNGAAAYEATVGLPETVGAHWRQWGRFSDEQIAALFEKWYYRANPTRPVRIDNTRQPPLRRDPIRVAL